jgi:ketosteroid isomerase-like protein
VDAREVPEALLGPNFRLENVVTAVTDRTYHGVAGVREWMRETFDGFEEGARYEVEKILADGDDFVVGRVAIVGSGARSGAPLQLRWTNVFWFQGGKATRGAGYATRREALKAVGLGE